MPNSKTGHRSGDALGERAVDLDCGASPRTPHHGAAGVHVIDGQGAWVMPGIIDCHSHMVAGGNEGTLSVTPEVRCEDNMFSDDLGVYRAAAGGVTAANVLHGSANTIGGQRIVIQMKYKANPKDMLFKVTTEQFVIS